MRSCLKTARNTQPWPWKSANCVCSSFGLSSGVPSSEELGVAPEAALRARPSGLRTRDLLPLCFARIPLLRLRIHELAVGLVVPPRVAEVGRHHVRARVHVARHALARRDRRVKTCSIGWPGSLLRDRRVARRRLCPRCPSAAYWAGVHGRAVVRVDDVAGGAAAGAVVAGLVVRSQERQQRVEQARLLQAEEDGIGAASVPRPRSLSFTSGPARLFLARRDCRSRRLRRPPRSNTRSTLPGCVTSNRGSGSRNGRMPFVRVSSGVGGGHV